MCSTHVWNSNDEYYMNVCVQYVQRLCHAMRVKKKTVFSFFQASVAVVCVKYNLYYKVYLV